MLKVQLFRTITNLFKKNFKSSNSTRSEGSFPLQAWNGAIFVLLIFPRLKSKRALSEAKKSIKKQRILHSTLVMKTSLNR